MSTFKEGLEDVVVATSSICFIDGARGILSYRGIDIHELAEKSRFEEVCYLLWFGRLPKQKELDDLTETSTQKRTGSKEVIQLTKSSTKNANTLHLLRSA